jgi:hypothetical protein
MLAEGVVGGGCEWESGTFVDIGEDINCEWEVVDGIEIGYLSWIGKNLSKDAVLEKRTLLTLT